MHSSCINDEDSLDSGLLPEGYFHEGLAVGPEETNPVGRASKLSGATQKRRGLSSRSSVAEQKLSDLAELFNNNPEGWLPDKDHPKLRRMWYMCTREKRHQDLFRWKLSSSQNMLKAFQRC
jgi:hypothetical protein